MRHSRPYLTISRLTKTPVGVHYRCKMRTKCHVRIRNAHNRTMMERRFRWNWRLPIGTAKRSKNTRALPMYWQFSQTSTAPPIPSRDQLIVDVDRFCKAFNFDYLWGKPPNGHHIPAPLRLYSELHAKVDNIDRNWSSIDIVICWEACQWQSYSSDPKL